MSTIVADTTYPTFPECPGFGFTAEPRYLTKAIEREGGQERVDRRWSRPLTFFTAVPTGNRDADVIQTILNFWHAVGGTSGRFRFKDFTDYKSCKTNETPAVTDQPFEIIGVTYQLVKQYIAASYMTTREIYRPIGSTIIVANTLGVTQTDWTLDESTGLLTPGSGFVGTPGSWGGEFDLPCRFLTDYAVTVVDGVDIQSGSFTLRECRADSAPVAPIVSSAPALSRAATPIFAPGSETFATSASVALSCSTPGSTVYYTTDGSLPSSSGSSVYSAPIVVSATTTIKAIATAPGFLAGAVGSATYTLAAGSPVKPSPPVLDTLTAGNGQVSMSFTPSYDGGSPVTLFTVTTDTGHTGTGAASPIAVTCPNGTAVNATVTATNTIGTSDPSAVSNTVTPAAPVTGGGSGGLVKPVFALGVFDWAGDWNAVPFNYADSSAGVSGPGPVIGVPGTTPYIYWLPYPPPDFAGPASNGVNFDLTGMTHFRISVKPSAAGGQLAMQFYKGIGTADDILYGNVVNITQGKYGPATMAVGAWNTYTIPLADFGVSGWIYKFNVFQQGNTPQAMKYDQVGFL